MNSIVGRKPARNFKASERGKCRDNKYCKRLVIIWKCVEMLTERGNTVLGAVEKIHKVYGYPSMITKLIQMMRNNKRNGRHA